MTREPLLLLTLADVPARLHKSPRWVRQLLKAHPCGRKAGRSLLFSERDLDYLYNSLPASEPVAIYRSAKLSAKGRVIGNAKTAMDEALAFLDSPKNSRVRRNIG